MIARMFEKTHSEKFSFVEEHIDGSEQEDCGNTPSVSFQCQKCMERFSSLKALKSHTHSETERVQTKSVISAEFIEEAKKNGIDYNLETFQNAFFSKREKKLVSKPSHSNTRRTVQQSAKTDVSKNFLDTLEKEGIEYSLEKFQKAFGFSDQEALSSRNLRSQKSAQPITKREKVVNSNLVKSLENEGVTYDLTTFQKAFGYEQKEFDMDECKSLDVILEELKEKGCIECQTCKTKLSNRNNYIRHMRNHATQEKNFFCTPCSKNFKTKLFLQFHIATNHGSKMGPVECPICLKNFTDSKALRSHFYIHQDERKFLCSR
jgi:Zinc-finger of C2H2 type